MFQRKIISYASVVLSVMFFYLSSLSVKLGIDAQPSLTHWDFSLSRFFIGFVGMLVLLPLYRKHMHFKTPGLLVARGVTNAIAVICFFYAVENISVAEANFLNMTYPVFISVFLVLFFKFPYKSVNFLVAGMAFLGIVLILIPLRIDVSLSYLIGLSSGIFAAFSIIVLNRVRQFHNPLTVLFYMFFSGFLITLFFTVDRLRFYELNEIPYLLASGFFGLVGQYFLTAGFKKIGSLEGGIISSSRIIVAALVSHFFLTAEILLIYDWIGFLLIFSANILIVHLTDRQRKKLSPPSNRSGQTFP